MPTRNIHGYSVDTLSSLAVGHHPLPQRAQFCPSAPYRSGLFPCGASCWPSLNRNGVRRPLTVLAVPRGGGKTAVVQQTSQPPQLSHPSCFSRDCSRTDSDQTSAGGLISISFRWPPQSYCTKDFESPKPGLLHS